MEKFTATGIIPAMVTPTDCWGNIDESATRKLVNHLLDAGVHGLCPIGSQGEFFALTLSGKKRVLELVISEAQGRVPIYAGTSALTTLETIETTKMARDLGVNAALVLAPFFTILSQRELFLYYQDVAEAVPDMPIILYNNPKWTKVPLVVDTVNELANIDNIVGIKDSGGDMSVTAEYIRRTKEQDFFVLSGTDTLIFAVLCYGGCGSITATANVVPEIPVEIYNAFIAGDYARALDAQFRLAPMRTAFNLGSFPVVVKEALGMIGIGSGIPIKPVEPLTVENRAALRKVLEGFNKDVLMPSPSPTE